MGVGNAQYNGKPPERPVQVYYTGLEVTGAAIPVDLAPGFVLIMDPKGPVQGVGIDYTRPLTNYLHCKKLVVDDVPNDAKRGGWITGHWAKEDDDVLVNDNITSDGLILGVSTGSFALSIVTVFAATNMATLQGYFALCGVSQCGVVNTTGGNYAGQTGLVKKVNFGLGQAGW